MSPPKLFHEYADLALSPAYVLGYAYHGLGALHAESRVHGRLGALALLNEMLATLTSLQLEAGLRAAEPLALRVHAMTGSPRSSRVGATIAADIVRTLALVDAAVTADLSARGATAPLPRISPYELSIHARRFLGADAYARCPEFLLFDLGEGCRALASHFPTASVFHLYRVWDVLGEGLAAPPGAGGGSIPDPRTAATVRCTDADAGALLRAIRDRLEPLAPVPPS